MLRSARLGDQSPGAPPRCSIAGVEVTSACSAPSATEIGTAGQVTLLIIAVILFVFSYIDGRTTLPVDTV